MGNALKSYCRRTILTAAREYAYPAARRTVDSTRSAFTDAMRGTDTGWWTDLIYTGSMLVLAHRYRADIATALAEYRDATGESYVYRPRHSGDGPDIGVEEILASLMRRRPWTFEEYKSERGGGPADAALLGLRFAVEWYAGELARDYCPDL